MKIQEIIDEMENLCGELGEPAFKRTPREAHDILGELITALEQALSKDTKLIEEIKEILYSHSVKAITSKDVVCLIKKEMKKYDSDIPR